MSMKLLNSMDDSPVSSKQLSMNVRAACGPLLEILEDETVSVIRYSFMEFLTDIS